MNFNCRFVSFPNVKKFIIFNAVVKNAAAQAAKFLFSSIERKVGIAGLQEPRLDYLTNINSSEKIFLAVVGVFDVTGLVAGDAEA